MPNYQSVTSVMINNMPSAPFSMSFVPPMGQANPQLNDALKRLSAAKHGRPRAVVEKEIFDRLGSAEKEKQTRLDAMKRRQAGASVATGGTPKSGGSSFLDDWLAKRQQLASSTSSTPAKPAVAPSTTLGVPQTASLAAPAASQAQPMSPAQIIPPANVVTPAALETPTEVPQMTTLQDKDGNAQPEKLQLRGDSHNADSEVAIKFQR